MDLKQLYEAYKGKIAEAKALTAPFEGKLMPVETAQKVNELLGEADQLKAQIEQAERIAKAEKFLEEPLEAKTPGMGKPNGPQGADVTVVVDEGDQPLSDGDFFKAVKTAALYPGLEDPRLRKLSLKATGLSEGVPAEGGYLLTPQLSGRILERMYSIGELLRRVASDPVSGNSMLYNAIDESSRADGSRYGGVRGYWVAEGGTITASKPTWRQMELKLKKVAALCYATDEQLEDTANLESWLNRVVPEELRFQAEAAIYNGNGVGKPLGIMSAPCLISVTRIDANEIDSTDVANLWARRWTGVSDYVWLISGSIFPQLAVLSIGNFPAYMPAGGLSGTPYATILGRPVIETEYNAALGTTGDIMLASLSQYQTISKGGVKSASSIHVQFVTDETAFRFTYRIDGQPLWNSALTPYNAGSTVGPFVVLTSASA